jgi:hypothetical protein
MTTAKICTDCGKHLEGEKRVKDVLGQYFCHPCWSKKSKTVASTVIPTPVVPVRDPRTVFEYGVADQPSPVDVTKTTLPVAESNPTSPAPTAAAPPKSVWQTNLGEAALAGFKPSTQQRLKAWGLYLRVAIVVAAHVWIFIEYGKHGVSGVLLTLLQVVVVATSIWVGFDARVKQVPLPKRVPFVGGIGSKRAEESPDPQLDPVRWFGGCLAIWIVFFPLYLAKRNSAANGARSDAATPPTPEPDAALRSFKKLYDEGIISAEEWEIKKKELLGVRQPS